MGAVAAIPALSAATTRGTGSTKLLDGTISSPAASFSKVNKTVSSLQKRAPFCPEVADGGGSFCPEGLWGAG